jgi:glycosyltransferase involved in cell wall biosynthesis
VSCSPSGQPPAFVRCTAIIATLDRPDNLRLVLDCLERQSRPPLEIIISAAGDLSSLAQLAGRPANPPVRLMFSTVKSAALQRNQAAAQAAGDVLAFLDDDIEFGCDLFARVLDHFDRRAESELGALSPRIANAGRETPGRLTRWYYGLQAGYADADYGGRLFGPSINCFPVFYPSGPEMLRADWLPSTCLFMRSALFRRHLFPQFSGYSFAEDVHLTARAAREAPAFFLREPSIVHHSLASEFKADRVALTAGKLHNMAVVAREAMGLGGWSLWWRWQLHRLFLSAVLLIRRPARWADELRGVWQAQL